MAMWYLIIPPFVIVLSLGVLLWFLSKRMGDSDIAEKLSSLRESTQTESKVRSLSRRAFFLKMLEMVASKFKTSTLRVHNFFQSSLERLRRQRTELDTIRKSLDEGAGKGAEEKPDLATVFGQRKEEETSFLKKIDADDLVVKTTISEEAPVPQVSIFGSTQPVPRPMLQEKVVHPEVSAGRTMESPREETLIARIVENPRDAAAYEELGDCYFAVQNLQDAKECYRQAIKLHPTNRAVKIKIRRLEKVFEERGR